MTTTKIPSTIWQGKNVGRYTYYVYQLPTTFNAGQDGNYIFSKIRNGMWAPIYIGQGDLGTRTNPDQHHQGACIRRKGATHVHVHLNASKASRLAEEKDLLANYPEAYKPTGCNEQ